MVRSTLLLGLLISLLSTAQADSHVVIISKTDPDYTRVKFVGAEPKPESYVFMEGNYFPGISIDHSIERMKFRQMAEILAPQLAKQAYFPTTKIAEADLLLVVHWGTTLPYVGIQEMTQHTTTGLSPEQQLYQNYVDWNIDMTDPSNLENIDPHLIQSVPASVMLPQGYEVGRDMEFKDLERLTDKITSQSTQADNISLLGYAEDLYQLGKRPWMGETEKALQMDLVTERYFLIIKAYNLKLMKFTRGLPKPVWTMHLNISTPGNNFFTAMGRMSVAGGDFFGRPTERATIRRAQVPKGSVDVHPLVILGEAK